MDYFEAAKWSFLYFTIAVAVMTAVLLLLRKRLPLWLNAALGVCFCGGLLLVDMYVVEPNWIAVERVTIHNDRLAAVLGDTQVVQISDLHIGERPRFREESLVRTVNGLEPDLLLITGDFISSREGIAAALEVTGQLKAKLGKFAVPGNNDNYQFKPGEMRQLFPAAGVEILVNENRCIALPNGRSLNLVGVDDPVTGRARIDMALAGVLAGEPVLLLAHTPSYLPVAVGKGIDLLLAGHSHGGQFGIDWLVHAFRGESPTLTSRGLYREGETTMYVNRGIGTTTKPLRFLCRPEVTVFEFRE